MGLGLLHAWLSPRWRAIPCGLAVRRLGPRRPPKLSRAPTSARPTSASRGLGGRRRRVVPRGPIFRRAFLSRSTWAKRQLRLGLSCRRISSPGFRLSPRSTPSPTRSGLVFRPSRPTVFLPSFQTRPSLGRRKPSKAPIFSPVSIAYCFKRSSLDAAAFANSAKCSASHVSRAWSASRPLTAFLRTKAF